MVSKGWRCSVVAVLGDLTDKHKVVEVNNLDPRHVLNNTVHTISTLTQRI